MKYIFLIVALLLLALWTVTHFTEPDLASEVPVIYWVTDANPVRLQQVNLFKEWLVENGYVTESGDPILELRLDTANREQQKKIIQGVSGVAADIIDNSVPGLDAYGLLEDVAKEAAELGFGMDKTYPALRDILVDGERQLGYPCNVAVQALWCNLDVFKKYGMEAPPRHWDIETFERIGREFVKRANPEGERQQVYFTSALFHHAQLPFIFSLFRSTGLSVFNETLTACTLDDSRLAFVFEKLHQWTYEDRIAPTESAEASFASQSGYGGADVALFQRGNYGMLITGRYRLIRLRQMEDPPQLSVSYFPYKEFENAIIETRASGVYAGSEHKDLACLFLAFLAGESYNQSIIDSADALPPNPDFTRRESFLRPPEYPNEWGTHEAVAEAARSIAVPYPDCPYVDSSIVKVRLIRAIEEVMNNLQTAEEAVADLERRINLDIRITLENNQSLQEEYTKRVERQEKIDAWLADGKKVPIEWIKNPFLRAYYEANGMTRRSELP